MTSNSSSSFCKGSKTSKSNLLGKGQNSRHLQMWLINSKRKISEFPNC